MKFKDLQKLDQDIIMALSSHKVADEIPNSTTYNNLGTTALYLITTIPEEQRRTGIIKKMKSGIAINSAVDGYTLASLNWLDELIGG